MPNGAPDDPSEQKELSVSERDLPVHGAPGPAPPEEPASAEASGAGLKWLSLRARSLRLSEGNLFLILAIVIGLFSGFAVVCFRMTIEWIRLGLLGSALAPPPLPF